MSTVNVWDGTQWQLMNDKGPVGDQGPRGDKGTSSRISNCITFTGNQTENDGAYEPVTLAPSMGSQGVQPCMALSGTGRLKAVKAGVHVITLRVQVDVNVTSTLDNWFIIERSVAVGGETRIAAGDVAYGGFGHTAPTQVWLGIGEEIWFMYSKKTNGLHHWVWTINAVMQQ